MFNHAQNNEFSNMTIEGSTGKIFFPEIGVFAGEINGFSHICFELIAGF